MGKDSLNFHIISMSTYGIGLSGGDRIFIELSKRLTKEYLVSVYLWEEGLQICKREGLEDVNFVLWSAKSFAKLGFFINYFARVFIGIFKAFLLKVENAPTTIIYSASEFWQDSLPAVILKLRHPKIKWVAAWYMSAPNPFRGFKEKGQLRLLPDIKALAYWVVQQPIKPLIKKFADLVFITSEPDKLQFPRLNKLERIAVIKGGVDLDKVNLFKKTFSNLPKIYDGVFQGRFHPQKGVIELIDIWKMVVAKKPGAKLVMIGDGPLMESVKLKVKKEKLEENIKLFGYVFDGSEKYRIFSQSRIVVHPAIYDSGGMAAAEAMAFGLPGIAFDLEALKTYYPKGMIKVPIGNLDAFSEKIEQLLTDKGLYLSTQKEAIKIVHSYWDWGSVVKRILQKLK